MNLFNEYITTYRQTIPSWLTALLATMTIGIFAGVFLLFNQNLFTYTGDAINVAQRSHSISQGSSPLAWHDPPLRYIPIAIYMRVLSPVGLSPFSMAASYTILVEFLLIPASFGLVISQWCDERECLYAVIALLIGTVVEVAVSPSVQGWLIPLSPYIQGYWMYDYAILTSLFATYFAVRGRPVVAGIWLGATALIQFILAAVAAITVAVIFVLANDRRSVGVAAITSMIFGLGPLIPFFMRYSDYFVSMGSGRLFKGARAVIRRTNGIIPNPTAHQVTIFGIGITAVIVIGLVIWKRKHIRYIASDIQLFLTGHSVAVLLFAFFAITISSWYYQLLGYYLSYPFYIGVGILAARIGH